MAQINGIQTIGLLMIGYGIIFWILPAIGLTVLFAIFGAGILSGLGLFGLIPGGIIVFIGFYLFQHGGNSE